MEKNEKPKLKIPCPKCGRTFRSTGYRDAHVRKMHKQPEPRPTPTRTEREVGAREFLTEEIRLVSGRDLHPGDVFVLEKRFVVREITKSDGSNTVTVEAECIKREWRRFGLTV